MIVTPKTPLSPDDARAVLQECGVELGEAYCMVRFPARYKLIAWADRLGYKGHEARRNRKSRIALFYDRLQKTAKRGEKS